MVRRLIFVIVLVALAGGVVSGTPLRAPQGKMMKCCDKAKNKNKTAMSKAAGLCCAVVCSDATPTSSSSSTNFAPSSFTIIRSISDQFAAFFADENVATMDATRYSREVLLRSFQPKFIQHNSFLI